jgi:GNAT superfamily N-acetyltransferase
MAVITRRVDVGDAARLRAVRLRALESDPLAFGSTYDREVGRDAAAWEEWARAHASGAEKATFLAIDGDDATLGIAAGMRESADATFGLYSMWVAPEARRSSIGRKLVEAVVAWAESHGARRIQLWVTQAGAIAFYERCSFADDGRRQPLPHTPDVIEVGMTRVTSAASAG